MKKLFLVLATLFTMSVFAQEKGDDNGFGLKFHFGLTGSSKYGLPDGLEDLGKLSGYKAKVSFGGTIDNRWYVGYPGNCGIAIMAKWLDVSITGVEHPSVNGNAVGKATLYSFDALGLGVIGTFYLNNNMMIDIYYNAAPNALFIREKGKEIAGVKADDEWSGAMGVSHTMGADFRYKIFLVGAEFKLAKPKQKSWFMDDDEKEAFDIASEIVSTKINTNRFRVFVGFKF